MTKSLGQRPLLRWTLGIALFVSPSMMLARQQAGGVTADQAKNDKGDLQITRKIRRDVVKDKSLSVNGHNVKIVTAGGKVTLEGPVSSDYEKKTILQYAQKYAGNDNVTDQTTVTGGK